MLGLTSSGVSPVKVGGGIDRVEVGSVRVHLLRRPVKVGGGIDRVEVSSSVRVHLLRCEPGEGGWRDR